MILVWKYSRFARSREDSIVYKAILRKNRVQVVSITEPFDDTLTGRLLEAIIESLDEFYSDNLGEEVALTYTIPLSPKGVSEEKVEVLSTVQNGGRYWT